MCSKRKGKIEILHNIYRINSQYRVIFSKYENSIVNFNENIFIKCYDNSKNFY